MGESVWKRLGMREKKRKAKLAYQMGFFLYLPMLSGVFCGVVFAALTAKARLYTGSEIWHFAGSLAAVYGIWCLVWVLAYEILNGISGRAWSVSREGVVMKEYSKYQKKIRICQIFASAAAAAAGFFLPFPMDGSRTCGVLLFGRMVTEMKFRSEYILLVVYLLLSLLHLLRIFLLIRKKPIGILYRLEPMAFWVAVLRHLWG